MTFQGFYSRPCVFPLTGGPQLQSACSEREAIPLAPASKLPHFRLQMIPQPVRSEPANRILLAKGNRRCSTKIDNRFVLSFYEAQCMHCNETQCCEIDGAATAIQPNERHLPLLLARSQGDDGFVPGRTEGVLEEERVPSPRRQPGTAPPRVLADQDRAAPAGPRRQSEDHARRRFVGYGGDMLLVQDMSNLRDI